MSRLIVLEVNELPPRVLHWWGATTPDSPLWQLTRSGRAVDTMLVEDLPRDLYPSQSWASVGMGVPWREHGVFWYGDPKPHDHPFYWQRAAEAGNTVGLVGVLHTSPIAERCASDLHRFVIPDVFSGDPETRPDHLRPLQELNLRLSRQSARVASTRISPADLRGAIDFARHGVQPATFAELARLAAGVGSRRWNKERLRVGQSLVMADIFMRLIERHDTDLSVLFTNHVASAMHRYWAATFPDDWDEHPYGPEWIAHHDDELPFAMRATDRIVARLQRLAKRTDRELVIVSSMGQQADLDVDPDLNHQAIIKDPDRLLRYLGCPFEAVPRPTMVPQLSFTLPDAQTAERFSEWVRAALGPTVQESMQADDTVTLTCDFESTATQVRVGDLQLPPERIGAAIEAITDHRSGRHHPRGVLISSATPEWPDELDALSVGDRLLERLGVAAALTTH